MGVPNPESRQIRLGKYLLGEMPTLQYEIDILRAAKAVGITNPNTDEVRRQMWKLVGTYYRGILRFDRRGAIRFAPETDTAALETVVTQLQERAKWPPHKLPETPSGSLGVHRVKRRIR